MLDDFQLFVDFISEIFNGIISFIDGIVFFDFLSLYDLMILSIIFLFIVKIFFGYINNSQNDRMVKMKSNKNKEGEK